MDTGPRAARGPTHGVFAVDALAFLALKRSAFDRLHQAIPLLSGVIPGAPTSPSALRIWIPRAASNEVPRTGSSPSTRRRSFSAETGRDPTCAERSASRTFLPPSNHRLAGVRVRCRWIDFINDWRPPGSLFGRRPTMRQSWPRGIDQAVHESFPAIARVP